MEIVTSPLCCLCCHHVVIIIVIILIIVIDFAALDTDGDGKIDSVEGSALEHMPYEKLVSILKVGPPTANLLITPSSSPYPTV